MPRRGQVGADVFTGTDQVPRRLLFHAGHRDRHDLAQVQQPGQVPGIAHIGLDPIPRRTLQLRRRRDQAIDTFRGEEPGQPEPGRPGLVGHRDRPRQTANPPDDLGVVRAQPALEQLPGLPVQTTRHDRTRVHV
jgi:hypothetical protein